MRALWIESWGGPLQQGDRPEPDPGPDEVLVDVEACGIGLTVLNCIRGDLGGDPADLPRIPGHELIGRIAACGPGVDPGREGERVMAYFYLFCGRCERCAAGEESLCRHLRGYVGVNCDGGYAERAVLPAGNAAPLPEAISGADAVAIPDAIATPVHVVGRAAIGAGDRVAVIAAGGGVGVHMVQVARATGAEVVALEAAAPKLEFLAESLGIEVLDSTDFASTQLPASWHGRADVVVDLLGNETSLAWSQERLAPGGRMVVLTTFPGVTFAANPRELVLSEASILGSRYASRAELAEAARLVADGTVRPVVSSRTGPQGVDGVHDALLAGSVLGRGALLWGDPLDSPAAQV